jgi:hypothetical protein
MAIHGDAVVLDQRLIPEAQVMCFVGDAFDVTVRHLKLTVGTVELKQAAFAYIRQLLLPRRSIVELKRYLTKGNLQHCVLICIVDYNAAIHFQFCSSNPSDCHRVTDNQSLNFNFLCR